MCWCCTTGSNLPVFHTAFKLGCYFGFDMGWRFASSVWQECMWLQGIWPWRGRMFPEIKWQHAFLAEVRTLLDHITSLPMAFQRKEPSLRGEILISWNCFSSISHSVSWLLHNLFMVTGSECHMGFQEDMKIPMQIRAYWFWRKSFCSCGFRDRHSCKKFKCAMAIFTLWALLQAIPIGRFPVMHRLAGAWHFQRKRSSCNVFCHGHRVQVTRFITNCSSEEPKLEDADFDL